jgi:hypothetical protein
MRLVGILILALIASALAGSGALAAVSYLPDWDGATGRVLDAGFRTLLAVGYVFLSFILFGLALWRRDRLRRLKRALYILLLVPFLVVVLGRVQDGVQQIIWTREAVGMVQMFMPLWIVALVQWAILHRTLSWQARRPEAASA